MATGSGDDIASAMGPDQPLLCNACCEAILSTTPFQKIGCGHVFHKNCLAKCVKTRPFCPICNTRIVSEPLTPSSSHVRTRSQSRSANSQRPADNNINSALDNSAGEHPTQADNITQDKLQEMVAAAVSAQQSQFLASLSSQIVQIIDRNIEARLTASNPPLSQPQQGHTTPQQAQTLSAVENRTFRELFGLVPNSENQGNIQPRSNQVAGNSFLNMSPGPSSSTDLVSRPDKVLQIMSNWKLKFNGGLNSISVENFLGYATLPKPCPV